jgi:predicted nuclease of predicted toxin-antitoxin system
MGQVQKLHVIAVKATSAMNVTKDSDFVTTFLLHGTPPKLLRISTGNISNDALSRLIAANLTTLETAFAKHSFIELNASTITVHA